MALKKQVSSLFRKRSSKAYELPAEDVDRTGPSQFRPLQNIQEDDDDELKFALQASMDYELENSRKQIEQLKAEITASARELEPRADRMAPAQAFIPQHAATLDEIARLKGMIASLEDDNKTQRDYFEHTQRDFAQQVQEVEARLEQKLRISETKIKDLTFNNDMFKASNEMGRAELMTKNETIASLEERLTWVERSGNADSSVTDLLRLQAALRKENQGLRNQVLGFDQEKQKMLAWFQKKRAEMSDAQVAFEAQMAQVIAEKDDAKQTLNALAAASQDLERFRLHFSNTTPRALLMMNASSRRCGSNEPTDSCRRFRETGAIQHLSRASLDLPLSPSEASNFLESLNHNQDINLSTSITLKMCSLCQNPKFMQQSLRSSPLGERLNEFPKGFEQTTCCSASVCASCLPTSIFKAIETDWWHNLDSQAWIRCPVINCEQVLSIKNAGELERMLYRLGDDQVRTHLAMYEKATVLRAALQMLSPRPSAEVLTISSNLHSQLIMTNRMYSFFDPRFNNTIPDEYGRLPEFNPGNLLLADIDQGDQTIPIFTRFLRRTATPRECSICAESRYELDIENVDAWRTSCQGFQGPWMWNVLLFPTKYSLECEHEMDACKECVATHLSTQLEEFGVNGCDRLSCLTCSRLLTHREVKLHAKPDTFQKYDRFHLLKMLSAEPNFRWCLREGCSSGQLYEQTEYLDPHILCEECEFEMCFTHQHPWHEGLTCSQFDSQREHGDPDFHDTQEWLRENTKPCPGCRVDVEKDAGCFHMTCRACTHEFCWTCLADWNLVNPSSGEYRRDAHNVGCFFRTSNVQPTAIQGNDLQAALGGRT